MNGKNPALLVIDFQVVDFNREKILYKSEQLINNVKSLLTRAQHNNIPIFLTKHNGKIGSPSQKGTNGWKIHQSIELVGNEIIIEKSYPDSFQSTDLESQLNLRNINQLFICGVETEICVDSTCRQAFGKGYEVTIVKDGHSTYNSSNILAEQIINHHNDIFENWFASVTCTDEIHFDT